MYSVSLSKLFDADNSHIGLLSGTSGTQIRYSSVGGGSQNTELF